MRVFTLVFSLFCALSAFCQGAETFINIPAPASNYTTRTWTGDGGISWTATDARTDQTINGKAIAIRFGALTSGAISNGIGNLTFQTKYLFTGSAGSVTIRVNGTTIGTAAVPSTQTTAATVAFNNINVAGSFILEIEQTVSGARIAIDNISWTAAAPGCTPPATSASAAAITNTTFNSFDVGCTAGSGTNSLVVVKASSAVAGVPVNGTTYTANSSFGTGQTIATGEYVVYNGTGTSVSVNGLAAGTMYHVAVFTFDGTTHCYKTISPAIISASTTCAEPTIQVNNITSTPAVTTATINWSGGNGTASLVKINTANSFTAPVDGTTYTSATTYTGGEQVVYSGTGSLANITGLTATTTYYVTVFTFNNCGGLPDYLTSGTTVQTVITNNSGIPVGYYSSVTSQTCANLKTALSIIITNGHVQLSYSQIDDDNHPVTDDRLNDAGTQTIVWDMYSDNTTGPEPYQYTFAQAGSSASAEGQGWNKEHSFPNSWFSGTSSTNNFPGADLHHIYPTDIRVNSLRGNLPYGTVATASTTTLNGSKVGSSAIPFPGYSGDVFEPVTTYKGDLARTTLYMVTRYQPDQASWENLQPGGNVVMDGTAYPSIEIDYLRLLLSWHNADPVSQKEIDRNDAVYSFQGNRNPFIDHPEYVGQIWSGSCGLLLPVDLTDFKATLSGNSVKLTWKIENAQGFSHFIVERSINGGAYEFAAQVQWLAFASSYSFTDDVTTLSGKVLYRLKMVDLNNTFKTSKVLGVNISGRQSSIYPNPVKDQVRILFRKPTGSKTTARIIDLYGCTVYSRLLPAGEIQYSLPIKNLPPGYYTLQLTTGSEATHQPLVVVR